MKIINKMKYAALVALVLGMAVGCATTTETGPTDTTQGCAPADAQAAIDAAQETIDRAAAEGALWRDTQAILDQAREALAQGDCERAMELANQARRQAENALGQKTAQEEGRELDSYVVERGDSLWRISGKTEVYGNPYQWPLIFKANRDQIKDADLIYPGQQLRIDRSASSADIDAAIRHARTRGAWSIGVTEDSDRAYLSE